MASYPRTCFPPRTCGKCLSLPAQPPLYLGGNSASPLLVPRLTHDASPLCRADAVLPGHPYWYLGTPNNGAAQVYPYPRSDAYHGQTTYSLTYRLPEGLSCPHCVLRWWVTPCLEC
jgi:hypothetical protein